jgi:hypothetical protein
VCSRPLAKTRYSTLLLGADDHVVRQVLVAACRASRTVPQIAWISFATSTTAQTMLGHSEARLTLDVYAQAVAKLGEAAAEAKGARFLVPAARYGRATPSGSNGEPG